MSESNGFLNIGYANSSFSGSLNTTGVITYKYDGTSDVNFYITQPDYSLRVKKLDDRAQVPTRAHTGDLGFDLCALDDVTLTPGQVTKVRTGIACGFPPGYGALIRDRSSVATKQQVFVVAGVIDNEYRGEVLVALYNPAIIAYLQGTAIPKPEVTFKAGDKIAQMILTPVVWTQVREVSDLDDTSRGTNGFGSSGR